MIWDILAPSLELWQLIVAVVTVPIVAVQVVLMCRQTKLAQAQNRISDQQMKLQTRMFSAEINSLIIEKLSFDFGESESTLELSMKNIGSQPIMVLGIQYVVADPVVGVTVSQHDMNLPPAMGQETFTSKVGFDLVKYFKKEGSEEIKRSVMLNGSVEITYQTIDAQIWQLSGVFERVCFTVGSSYSTRLISMSRRQRNTSEDDMISSGYQLRL